MLGLWLMLGAALLFLVSLRISVTQVNAATLRDELKSGKKLHIIDVREPAEFRRGRIPGARNVPLGQLPKAIENTIKPDDDIVLVCATGARSAIAFRKLRRAGYKNARNLTGGMRAWHLSK